MAAQTASERELAELLTQVLNVEDISPAEIDPQAPLFGIEAPNSLGLDSIDALELSLAIAQKYGVKLKANDENNKAILSSLRSLTDYITSQK